MARRQRECYLCGESYKYCPTCSQDRTKPSWMTEFHSESCKDIFDICTRYNLGMMSKIEAQEALSTCDLTNKTNFKSYVQHDLEVIFEEEPIIANVVAKIEKVTEDEVVVDVATVSTKEKKSHEVITIENE